MTPDPRITFLDELESCFGGLATFRLPGESDAAFLSRLGFAPNAPEREELIDCTDYDS
jgi:hypothetical protein